jgi:hypothetical protein
MARRICSPRRRLRWPPRRAAACWPGRGGGTRQTPRRPFPRRQRQAAQPSERSVGTGWASLLITPRAAARADSNGRRCCLGAAGRARGVPASPLSLRSRSRRAHAGVLAGTVAAAALRSKSPVLQSLLLLLLRRLCLLPCSRCLGLLGGGGGGGLLLPLPGRLAAPLSLRSLPLLLFLVQLFLPRQASRVSGAQTSEPSSHTRMLASSTTASVQSTVL